MAFVTAKPTTRKAPNRRPADPYSAALRLRPPPEFNLYDAPSGTLTGLEALAGWRGGSRPKGGKKGKGKWGLGDAGPTGIPFFDDKIAAATGKVDQVSAALKISTAAAVASLGISVFMLARSLRRGG